MKSSSWIEASSESWYDELSNFLMSKGFTKGNIDPTLFTIRYGEDIILVQIYVDDIIFGSTNLKFSKIFEKLMHSRFEMSLMGELKFFLGLQIHQSLRAIFINQAKYALEILKKHGMDKCDSIDADNAKCLYTRKSTYGGIQFLGEKLVCWMSKKQDCTAMSIAKAYHSNLMQPHAALPYQAHQCLVPLHKGTDRFEYLVRQLGMRCLTPAELEVLANEYA
ncbi:retrovirus-related pol polyprotein from transposon TNT 1-94 [Tanacetum coccineum]